MLQVKSPAINPVFGKSKLKNHIEKYCEKVYTKHSYKQK